MTAEITQRGTAARTELPAHLFLSLLAAHLFLSLLAMVPAIIGKAEL